MVLLIGWLCTSSMAQQTAQYNYGTFNHTKHDEALVQAQQSKISCDVCHRRDSGSTQLYYPGHDACVQCHIEEFTTQSFDICAVCHTDVKQQGRALSPFPAQRTEFAVQFDGAKNLSQHDVHMKEALPDGQKMTCAFCHASQGANQAFPSHPECYACHAPNVKSKAASPELVSCATCHPAAGSPNSEIKRLINTRRNDALGYRFRHLDHTRAMGTGCVECHRVTDAIHVVSSRTKEHQTGPRFNCYECHRSGGRSRITETQCAKCHGVIVF